LFLYYDTSSSWAQAFLALSPHRSIFFRGAEKYFYLSGWIEKDGKIEYDKETSKKRTSMTERG